MIWITEIIPKYLTLVLTWPVAVFVLGVVFIALFKIEIRFFITNISKIKWGNFETTQQGKAESSQNEELKDSGNALELLDEATVQTGAINQEEIINALITRAEFYEFAYLDKFLVYNSKQALLWFQNPSTKDHFITNFQLLGQIANPIAEKEAIFSALISNSLIQSEGLLVSISEKGIKFLKHIKLIA